MLYCLADRLLLLKCYDNKMVKLRGCPSEAHVAGQQQQKKNEEKGTQNEMPLLRQSESVLGRLI